MLQILADIVASRQGKSSISVTLGNHCRDYKGSAVKVMAAKTPLKEMGGGQLNCAENVSSAVVLNLFRHEAPQDRLETPLRKCRLLVFTLFLITER